jgi:hypothetical protein
MAHEDGVDRLRRSQLEQTRQRRVSRIDEESEVVVLEQVAAAGAAGRRPGAGPAEDREPH